MQVAITIKKKTDGKWDTISTADVKGTTLVEALKDFVNQEVVARWSSTGRSTTVVVRPS